KKVDALGTVGFGEPLDDRAKLGVAFQDGVSRQSHSGWRVTNEGRIPSGGVSNTMCDNAQAPAVDDVTKPRSFTGDGRCAGFGARARAQLRLPSSPELGVSRAHQGRAVPLGRAHRNLGGC